jgi:hypothetical protein
MRCDRNTALQKHEEVCVLRYWIQFHVGPIVCRRGTAQNSAWEGELSEQQPFQYYSHTYVWEIKIAWWLWKLKFWIVKRGWKQGSDVGADQVTARQDRFDGTGQNFGSRWVGEITICWIWVRQMQKRCSAIYGINSDIGKVREAVPRVPLANTVWGLWEMLRVS